MTVKLLLLLFAIVYLIIGMIFGFWFVSSPRIKRTQEQIEKESGKKPARLALDIWTLGIIVFWLPITLFIVHAMLKEEKL